MSRNNVEKGAISLKLKQKIEQSAEAYEKGRYVEVYKICSEALKIDPFNLTTNKILYFNRGVVSFHLGKLEETIRNCTEAIKLDQQFIQALKLRAKCHLKLQMFDEAVFDLEIICKIEKKTKNQRFLKYAIRKANKKKIIAEIKKLFTEYEKNKRYRHTVS